jgi:hypothetical protein
VDDVDPLADLCPDCNGEGVTSWMAFDGRETLSDCTFCGGEGWLKPADIDDADHAEYVDPIDHTHDAPLASSTAADRLTAVLDIHRPTSNGVCQAEMHLLHPCPTARAALGIR